MEEFEIIKQFIGDTILGPKVRIGEGKVNPTGGVYIQLSETRDGSVKGHIRLKVPGEQRSHQKNYSVMLPPDHFDMKRPESKLNQILRSFNSGLPKGHKNELPIDALCMNTPWKLSERGEYGFISREMFEDWHDIQKKFLIMPIHDVRFNKKETALVRKGNTLHSGKSNLVKWEIAVKGRWVGEGFLEKEPRFQELSFKTYEAGFTGMLSHLLDNSIKRVDKTEVTVLPQLKPYNFHAVTLLLKEYWKEAAAYSKKTFDFDTSYTGSSMDPVYNNDILADIRRNVITHPKRVAPVINIPVINVPTINIPFIGVPK